MYFCAIILYDFSYQHVDEQSEGLVWASQEGCLEDVVFLLSTGVEVNSRSQVSDTVRSNAHYDICSVYATALVYMCLFQSSCLKSDQPELICVFQTFI